MSQSLFDPVPKKDAENSTPLEKNPFSKKELATDNFRKAIARSEDFADDCVEAVPIEQEVPFMELVDRLPGVPEVSTVDIKSHKHRTITLKGINEDVKEFTNDIAARRMDLQETSNKMEFIYDVAMVRIFGQYGATHEEMGAFFEVDPKTIGKLMADEQSDFFLVYHKANSLLKLSLRQIQIKSALGGSERLMIHLGKTLLGQGEENNNHLPGKESGKDSAKRRKIIYSLTKQIEEFDVD